MQWLHSREHFGQPELDILAWPRNLHTTPCDARLSGIGQFTVLRCFSTNRAVAVPHPKCQLVPTPSRPCIAALQTLFYAPCPDMNMNMNMNMNMQPVPWRCTATTPRNCAISGVTRHSFVGCKNTLCRSSRPDCRSLSQSQVGFSLVTSVFLFHALSASHAVVQPVGIVF